MSSSATKQPTLSLLRRGSIEINTLIIWIILLVFLVLVILIIVAVRTNGFGLLSSLCSKTGGAVGCTS